MATSKIKKTIPKKSVAKNSLVKNINAKKKAGTANPKSKSTVSKKEYKDMETNLDNKK